ARARSIATSASKAETRLRQVDSHDDIRGGVIRMACKLDYRYTCHHCHMVRHAPAPIDPSYEVAIPGVTEEVKQSVRSVYSR
ncbi:hypothetical protein BHE74_00048530, partial [Ensete ventricosum]